MSKNKVEVIIGGNIYTLQGDESEAHIQKVASLIDKQIIQIQGSYGKSNLNVPKVYMLSALNIANDYVKTQDELEAYAGELEKCNAENLALRERIEELSLELAQAKLQSKNTYYKKNERIDRGR